MEAGPSKRRRISNEPQTTQASSDNATPTARQAGASKSVSEVYLPPANDEQVRRMKTRLRRLLEDDQNRVELIDFFKRAATANDPTSESAFKRDPQGVAAKRALWRQLYIAILSPSIKAGSRHAQNAQIVKDGRFGVTKTGFFYSKSDLNEEFSIYPEFEGRIPYLLYVLWLRFEQKAQRRSELLELHRKTKTGAFEFEFEWCLAKLARDAVDEEIERMYAKVGISIPGSGIGFEHNFQNLFVDAEIKSKLNGWRDSFFEICKFAIDPQSLVIYIPRGKDLLEEMSDIKHPFFRNKGEAGLFKLNYADELDPSGQSFGDALKAHFLQDFVDSADLAVELTPDQRRSVIRSGRKLHAREVANPYFVQVALRERELADLAGYEYSMNAKKAKNSKLPPPETKCRDLILDFARKLIDPLIEVLARLDKVLDLDIDKVLADCKNASLFSYGKLKNSFGTFAAVDDLEEFSNDDDGSLRLAKAGPFNIYAGSPQHELGSNVEALAKGVLEYEEYRDNLESPPLVDQFEDYEVAIAHLIPTLVERLEELLSRPHAIKLVTAAQSSTYATLPSVGGYSIRVAIGQLTRMKAQLWVHRINLGVPLIKQLITIIVRSFVRAMIVPDAGFADLVTENSIRLLKASQDFSRSQRALIEAIKMGCKGMNINIECFTSRDMHWLNKTALGSLTTDPHWLTDHVRTAASACALDEICGTPVEYDIEQEVTSPLTFVSVLVDEGRTPFTLYDGLGRNPYFTCPAWIFGNWTYSAGISAALLRIIRVGHKSCKSRFGKAFELMGASKEEMRADEIRAEAGLGSIEENEMKTAEDDEDLYN